MTTDEQDAEIGRLVRERRDLRAKTEALISKLQKNGEFLSAIGKALTVRPVNREYPASTLTVDDNGTVQVAGEFHPNQTQTGRMLMAPELQQLLAEVKDAQRRLSEIDAQMKNLGL